MFNLLLTDDEVLTLENTRSAIERMRDRIPIGEIFTADCKNAAMEVFTHERVDILICDVEMPQGSGFDLAGWVRENKFNTEIIFLTCHADFAYAKRALSLETLDYLLKPVDWAELSTAILKAVTKLQTRMSPDEKGKNLSVPTTGDELKRYRYWEDVVRGNIVGTDETIAQRARHQGIEAEPDTTAVLILQSFHGCGEDWKEDDYPIIEYARKNLASELLLEGKPLGTVLSQWEQMLLIICCPADEEDIPRIRENCHRFIEICSKHLSMGAACYISDVCRLSDINREAELLHRAERKNVYRINNVFMKDEIEQLNGRIKQPDMEPWKQMLAHGKYDETIEAIVAYFQQPEVAGKIDDDFLQTLRRRLDRMFYEIFVKLGVTQDPDPGYAVHKEQYERAAHSIPEMLIWINGVIQGMRATGTESSSEQIIARVKGYISENLENDISREDIAGHVYLNADYLSRIFKRSEGISLMEYLIQKRIEVAKRLLTESTIPISDVALSVGYGNFSHFSKIFKKKTGMNPGEYRRKMQKPGGDGR